MTDYTTGTVADLTVTTVGLPTETVRAMMTIDGVTGVRVWRFEDNRAFIPSSNRIIHVNVILPAAVDSNDKQAPVANDFSDLIDFGKFAFKMYQRQTKSKQAPAKPDVWKTVTDFITDAFTEDKTPAQKIDEPQGLRAMVELNNGIVYQRNAAGTWQAAYSPVHLSWRHIADQVTTVLYAGDPV